MISDISSVDRQAYSTCSQENHKEHRHTCSHGQRDHSRDSSDQNVCVGKFVWKYNGEAPQVQISMRLHSFRAFNLISLHVPQRRGKGHSISRVHSGNNHHTFHGIESIAISQFGSQRLFWQCDHCAQSIHHIVVFSLFELDHVVYMAFCIVTHCRAVCVDQSSGRISVAARETLQNRSTDGES